MSWMHKMILGGMILRAPEGDGGGGGGGGGGGEGNKPDLAAELAKEREARTKLEERLAKLEGGGKGGGDNPDLKAKAEAERKAKETKDAESKQLEAALRFNLGSKDWLKTNASLLPKNIEGIFNAAEKENYGNAIEKDAAIKSGIVQEFFSVQANMDLLTPRLKSDLEDWLKMTKTGKQEKAQQIYDTIFEPAFEMLKRVKKAEQLNNGTKNQTDGEKALADRMMNLSKKHYLGEKHGS